MSSYAGFRAAVARVERVLAAMRLSLGEAGAVLLFVALACASVAIVNIGLLNDDSSWYLVATRMWMGGAVLYQGVIENNPPMMFYLTRAALQVGDVVGLDDKLAFLLFIVGNAVLSYVFVWALLGRSALAAKERGVFLCFVAIALLLVPLSVFGQREHFLVIFLLPLAVWMSFAWLGEKRTLADSADSKSVQSAAPAPLLSRYGSAMVGVACALFALLGLLLKPHFFLLPAVAIALRVIQHRSLWPLFAPANITLAAGAFAFVGFIYWIHPLYIDNIVPMTWRVYVQPENILLNVFSRPFLLLTVAVVVIIFAGIFARVGRGFLYRPYGILACMAMGGVVLCFLQGKGYYYHILPAQMLMLLAVGALLAESRAVQFRRTMIDAAVLVVLSFLAYVIYLGHTRHMVSYIAQVQDIAAEQGNPQSVLVLSVDFAPSWPLVNESGWRWTSRNVSQWIVHGAWFRLYARERLGLSAEEVADLQRVLDYTRCVAIEDFLVERPDIVIIDERRIPHLPDEPSYEFINFLSQDSRFVEVWSDYQQIGTISNFYTLYGRTGAEGDIGEVGGAESDRKANSEAARASSRSDSREVTCDIPI